jgi:hypothetical protein
MAYEDYQITFGKPEWSDERITNWLTKKGYPTISRVDLADSVIVTVKEYNGTKTRDYKSPKFHMVFKKQIAPKAEAPTV